MIPIRKNIKIKSAGIYQIESYINGKKYIGSSINIYGRIFNEHLKCLKNGVHVNIILQRHYNKYGENDLWFDILQFCPKSDLLECEQYWIDKLNPEFNICKKAGSPLGIKRTEETKQKMKENHADFKGVNHPNFGRHFVGGKHRFHKKGAEHKGNGITHTCHYYPNIRKSRLCTEETREKMREARRKRPLKNIF
jgi:group I intron endonuclease